MKKHHKLWRLLLLLFVAVVAVVLLLFYVNYAKQEPPQQPRGMFEWNEEAVYTPEDALELTQSLSVNRWYQEFPEDAEAMAQFTEVLHENNVKVYALLGSVEWGFEQDGASLTEALQALVQYNKTVDETQKLDGVMVDVEPYTSSRFKRQPEQAMSDYVDGLTAAYQSVQDSDLHIIQCIPRHYDDKGLTDELERLIANACDAVAVMNYECDKEVENIETEALFAKKYQKELHCILEFQEVGKHSLTEEKTYRNKGLERAHSAYAAVSAAYEQQSVVWDYHWTNPLRRMLKEMEEQ